jgi:gliding motility-associated-like protein
MGNNVIELFIKWKYTPTLLICFIYFNAQSQSSIYKRYIDSKANVRLVAVDKSNGGSIFYTKQVIDPVTFSVSSIIEKYDSGQQLVWALIYKNIAISEVKETANKELIIEGAEILSVVNQSSYLQKIFIARLSANGIFIWKKTFQESLYSGNLISNSSTYYFFRSKIIEALDASVYFIFYQNNILNGGYYLVRLGANGSFIWKKTIRLNLSDIQTGFDNNIILFGGNGPYFGYDNGFTVIDSTGTITDAFVMQDAIENIVYRNIFKDDTRHRYLLTGQKKNSKAGGIQEVVTILDSAALNSNLCKSYSFERNQYRCNSFNTAWDIDSSGNLYKYDGFLNPPNYNIIPRNYAMLESSFFKLNPDITIQWAKKIALPYSPVNFISSGLVNSIGSNLIVSGGNLYTGVNTKNPDLSNYEINLTAVIDTTPSLNSCLSVLEKYTRTEKNIILVRTSTTSPYTDALLTTDNTLNINSQLYAPIINDTCIQQRKPLADFDFFQLNGSGNFSGVVCTQSNISFRSLSYWLPQDIDWVFPPEADVSIADSTCYPDLRNIQFTRAGIFPVKLIASNSSGADTITKFITVVSQLTKPALGNDTSFCEGSSLLIVYKDVAFSSHAFRTLAGNFITSGDSLVITSSGTYICDAVSSCGYVSDTIVVNMLKKPVFFLGNDTVICASRTLTLSISAEANTSYNWSNGSSDTAILIKQPGQYYLNAVNSCGSFSDTIEIKLLQPIVADFSVANLLCENTSLNFKDITNTPDSIVLSKWYFTANDSITGKNVQFVYPVGGSKTIYHYVETANGCASTVVSKTIYIESRPQIDFTNTKLCLNEPVYFSQECVVSFGAISNYTWDFGNNQTAVIPNPIITYTSTGSYNVKLKAATAKGCADSITKILTLENLVANAGNDTAVFANTPFTLRGSGGSNYFWQPASLLDNNLIANPVGRLQSDQQFVLTVSNNQLCTSSDSVHIKILKPVYIPNAFTPNGDGINDKWVIGNLADYKNPQLTIFNRYGQIVYSSYNYQNNWDGRMNGLELPSGAYVYILQIKGINYNLPLFKGNVTILR